jgi:TonB family protein
MILPLLPELPANPATLEARSQDHAMYLDVIPAGADVACSVRITDLRTGEQLLASPKIALHGTRPDKSGIVRDVKVLKPLPFGLDQAAVDAVRQWRFAPATVNGEPLDVIFQMIIGFPGPAGQ